MTRWEFSSYEIKTKENGTSIKILLIEKIKTIVSWEFSSYEIKKAQGRDVDRI